MSELEVLPLRCDVVEALIGPEAVGVAVAAAALPVELEESSSSSSPSSKSSEVGTALPDDLVPDADADAVAAAAALPVAAVNGTALPAEQVMSGTPLMIPWLGSPRQQVKSLAALLLPVPPIR